MTGAEHYRKAEYLLDLASTTSGADDGEDALFVDMAQVHATLALAAATGANRCADRDTFGQQCHLEAGHDGKHSIPIPTADRAWA